MKELEQTYVINVPIEKVWQALIDPKIINEWGGGPAEMDDKLDTEWSLWGGDIHGKNTQVEPNHLLVQEWYGGAWEEPSICQFELKEKDDQTTVTLSHGHIPDEEFEDVESGWQDYYLGPIKTLLEKK